MGNADSLQKAFGKAQDHTSNFGSALKGLGKAAVLGLGAAGVGGAVAGAVVGFKEFAESQKVMAQTEAVLKSTGGAARVSATQIAALSQKLSDMSGVDDEAIQSGENLLLTFTNIQNRVGKGNDIFNKATKAALDMSTALGTDLNSSAIQLGKALNDPAEGLAKLGRAGVTFTDAQKASIKAMQEHGNVAGAQKAILAELTKEFGGSAEAAGNTFSGQIDKAKNALSNMAGEVVGATAPALAGIATKIATDVVPRLIELAGNLVDKVKPAAKAVADFISENWPKIKQLFVNVADFVRDTFGPIFQKLRDIVREAITKIAEKVQENMPQIKTIFSNIGTIIENLASIVIPLLKVAFTKVLPLAVDILVPALLLVSGTIAKISTLIRAVIEKAAELLGWAQKHGAALGAALSGPFETVRSVISAVAGFVDSLIGKILWVLDHLPHITGGQAGSIPGGGDFAGRGQGPRGFAKGGIVTMPTFAMIGESGPEAVIPLNRIGSLRGGGEATVHVHVHGNIIGTSPQQLARDLWRIIEPEANRGAASITTR